MKGQNSKVKYQKFKSDRIMAEKFRTNYKIIISN